ncbi:tRNA uridine-5-carboxymethylaminomethyl(34) synthesis GTPase MnmE [Arenibacterium sp. CAU 1754]
MDTIFALASAPGKAGVAVIRISGPQAKAAAQQLSGAFLPDRGMTVHTLTDAAGRRLDQALILTFQAPASFTGEEVAELQVHGSTAGVSAVLRALSDIEGLRQAEPGEFTRRALENGKMDLAQVEGLADLIDAETESQHRQAMRVLSGDLGKLAEKWRSDLIRAASLIEATIDFADEDVPVDVTPEVSSLLSSVRKDLDRLSQGVEIAERIRSGFEVAIIGEPNVGKSTLLNALAGRQAAITSEFAGTTRDVIEVRMDLGGLAVTLLDTAGIRETADQVETIGVSLARQRAEQADIRVFLAEDICRLEVARQPGDIVLKPKADLRDNKSNAISGATGEGVDGLIQHLTEELSNRSARAGLATRERHRNAMQQASESLVAAESVLAEGPDMYDIAAEEIRRAVRGLESLVGRVDVENLLDEIFASFCLGK